MEVELFPPYFVNDHKVANDIKPNGNPLFILFVIMILLSLCCYFTKHNNNTYQNYNTTYDSIYRTHPMDDLMPPIFNKDLFQPKP